MVDADIPIAYGTAVPIPVVGGIAVTGSVVDSKTATTVAASASAPARDLVSASRLNGGRSSRFVLPADQDTAQTTAATPLPEKTRRVLKDQGYTQGLAEALRRNKLAFPMAIWVVDNSGSMNHQDGHRIVESRRKNQVQFVTCTRWAEMQQTVDYHAQLAACLEAPTIFRLLNDPGRAAGPQQFSIAHATTSTTIDHDLAVAQQTMLNAQPSGVTPLVVHLQEIRDNVLELEPQLRAEGTKVVIVLATDGIPTNDRGISDSSVKQQFVEALRALEGLPVWVVVRLCTDEDNIVEYWNSLDAQLELNLEVLDDFMSEAEEVHEHNKWLNYGLPLHRMREMGFHSRLFDLLDERKLIQDELRDFCRILFGNSAMDGLPDPQADWKGFCQRIKQIAQAEEKTWNPITKKMEPWIDVKRLEREYARKGWFW